MLSKRIKRATAIILGATMLFAQSVSAFADAPSTTAGTGNILAYSVDTYVVPTSLSVALNPQGYAVTLRGTGNDAVTTTNQIVSLNYGVANLSSADKIIKLSVAVSGGSEVTFVESADAISDTDAAPEMYLALQSNTGDLKTSANAAFAVDVKSGANEHNVTAANLTDVTMTADATTAVAFGGESTIKAEKTFELGKATYAVKDGETVDFDTTQTQLAGKMEITALGGIKGFTITGAMNTKQDWTKLTAKTLTFTPTYEFIDAAAAAAEAQAAANNATSATTFKTTYAEVLALTADDVEGTEEELAAINAAATAFGNLSAEVKAILAEDDIDADFFTALAEASEAAAEANAAPNVSLSSDGIVTVRNLTSDKNFSSITLTGSDGLTVDYDTCARDMTFVVAGTWTAEDGGYFTMEMPANYLEYWDGVAVTATVTLSDGSTITSDPVELSND